MTDNVIESNRNPRVKSWDALRSRQDRDRTGTFLVEGRRETVRMMRHCDVVELIVRSDLADSGLGETVIVSETVFSSLSRRQHPDGVAAILKTPDLDIGSLETNGSSLVLVADAMQKPGNIGAMIRTADAFGATFVGSSLETDLVNPNVIRSAQGSLFSFPIADTQRDRATAWASASYTVIVASPQATRTLWDVDMTVPTAIVIGAEASGVHDDWYAVGTGVSIPTVGQADSLNASVSAAVLISEAARQRSA